MHFAACCYVGESVQDPGKYYTNNVAGTRTLLEAMRDHGVAPLVFSSTCATCGVPQSEQIDEDHPQQPINPYGASKLMVERMLADFDTGYGLRAIALRDFNAAGADPDAEIGEDHDTETHLIPLAIAAAAGTPDPDSPFTPPSTTRRTEPVSATTSTSPISLKRTVLPSTHCSRVRRVVSTTWITDRAARCARSSLPPSRSRVCTYPSNTARGAQAILPDWSGMRVASATSWVASLDAVIRNAWDWRRGPALERTDQIQPAAVVAKVEG